MILHPKHKAVKWRFTLAEVNPQERESTNTRCTELLQPVVACDPILSYPIRSLRLCCGVKKRNGTEKQCTSRATPLPKESQRSALPPAPELPDPTRTRHNQTLLPTLWGIEIDPKRLMLYEPCPRGGGYAGSRLTLDTVEWLKSCDCTSFPQKKMTGPVTDVLVSSRRMSVRGVTG